MDERWRETSAIETLTLLGDCVVVQLLACFGPTVPEWGTDDEEDHVGGCGHECLYRLCPFIPTRLSLQPLLTFPNPSPSPPQGPSGIPLTGFPSS